MKIIEGIQLEGNFKLKKIFSCRNQIPIDPVEDELRDLIISDKNTKIEAINPKQDFNPEVQAVNQVLNYERI